MRSELFIRLMTFPRKILFAPGLACMLVIVALVPGVAHAQQFSPSQPAGSSPVRFYQLATSTNVTGNYTDINNPATNNQPNVLVFVTQNSNPYPLINYPYNPTDPHPVGVWYNQGSQRWSIFNEDMAPMPIGIVFNVVVVNPSSSAFVQVATSANSAYDYTNINNPATNNNPNALLFITPDWNPGGTGGVYDTHYPGVWYNPTTYEWSIFHEDVNPIPNQAAFNVYVVNPSSTALSEVVPSNGGLCSNYQNWPQLCTDAETIIILTPNWNLQVYNNHPIGVGTFQFSGVWDMYQQDSTAVPANFGVNVLAFASS